MDNYFYNFIYKFYALKWNTNPPINEYYMHIVSNLCSKRIDSP